MADDVYEALRHCCGNWKEGKEPFRQRDNASKVIWALPVQARQDTQERSEPLRVVAVLRIGQTLWRHNLYYVADDRLSSVLWHRRFISYAR
jgi:hypothetical protein